MATVLTSCGGKGTSTETVDSTSVVVDSLLIDSTSVVLDSLLIDSTSVVLDSLLIDSTSVVLDSTVEGVKVKEVK